MPIDHFSNGNDTRTFRNRYWINQTYYQPGGPVFCKTFSPHNPLSFAEVCLPVFDSGEQNAEPLLPYYLQVRLTLSSPMHLVIVLLYRSIMVFQR